MTVKITKDKINVREKLSELDKPSGIAGEAMLRADTPAEQFELINAGRKNLIINGDMKVWQRGDTYTHDVTDATKPKKNYATVDRFQSMNNSPATATAGVYTAEAEMYDNKLWLKHGCTTPYNSSDYVVRGAVYFVEQVGYTLGRPSRFRNKELTLSYLFRAKQNGQYGVTVGGPNDDTFSIFSFDYTGSGETQKVSFTFTFPDQTPNGTKALRLYFNYGVDPTHERMSDDTNLNGIFAQDISLSDVAGITRQSDYPWWQVAGDWIAITEVQLEFGNIATPFEYRSYGEELALCQRYYYKTDTIEHIVAPRYSGSSGSGNAWWKHPVYMRASPSMSYHGTWFITAGYGGAPYFGHNTADGVVLTTSIGTTASGVLYLTGGQLSGDAEL